MMKFGSLRPTLTAFFLILVILYVSNADEELRCCHGWSDDLANMMVTKHKAGASCTAEWRCENYTCLYEYRSEKDVGSDGPDITKSPSVMATEDCFNWTHGQGGSDTCFCEKKWCNCPEAFRNQEPKPKTPGLQCCDNQDSNKPIQKKTCKETLPQPQGCTAYHWYGKVLADCGLGTRFADNCTEWLATHPAGKRPVTCYCQKDFCNCGLPPNTPNTTTNTTKSPNFQSKNYAPQIPLVLILSFFLLIHK